MSNKITEDSLNGSGGKKGSKRFIVPVVAVALLLGAAIAVPASLGAFAPEKTTENVKLNRTLTGKTAQQDREDSANALVSLLNSFEAPKSSDELTKKLESLDTDAGLAAIPESVSSNMLFGDGVTPKFKAEAYQSLMSLNGIVTLFGERKVTLVSDPSTVYLDQSTGRAFIPVALIGGDAAPVSLEMVFEDGRWKLDPYSFVASVKLTASLGAAQKS